MSAEPAAESVKKRKVQWSDQPPVAAASTATTKPTEANKTTTTTNDPQFRRVSKAGFFVFSKC
jgi:hypothetical protein